MATKLQLSEPMPVVVLDGAVHFSDFIETDPRVLSVLVDAENPEAVAHTILQVGAQCILIAQTDLDAQVIERRFEGMVRRVDATFEGVVTRIEKLLDETYDEDSKSSAIAKFDGVVEGGVQSLDRGIRSI